MTTGTVIQAAEIDASGQPLSREVLVERLFTPGALPQIAYPAPKGDVRPTLTEAYPMATFFFRIPAHLRS